MPVVLCKNNCWKFMQICAGWAVKKTTVKSLCKFVLVYKCTRTLQKIEEAQGWQCIIKWILSLYLRPLIFHQILMSPLKLKISQNSWLYLEILYRNSSERHFGKIVPLSWCNLIVWPPEDVSECLGQKLREVQNKLVKNFWIIRSGTQRTYTTCTLYGGKLHDELHALCLLEDR